LKSLVFKRIWLAQADATGLLFLLGSDTGDTLSGGNHTGGCHLGACYFFDLPGRTRPIVYFDALTEPQLAGGWFTGQRLRRHRRQLCKYSKGGQNTEGFQQSPRAEYFDCGWGITIDRHRSFSIVGKVRAKSISRQNYFSPSLSRPSLSRPSLFLAKFISNQVY
jgi:hypothetical protein